MGLAVALLIYGIAVGGLFALSFALVHGRVARLNPRATAALLALGAFLVLFLVSFVKYPWNPPGATEAETISQRTGLHLVMLLLRHLAAVVISAAHRLARRVGAWNAATLAAVAYLIVIGLTMAVMPEVDETPAGFRATVLYDFRIASIGTQVVLWASLGLVFGALVEGAAGRERAPSGV